MTRRGWGPWLVLLACLAACGAYAGAITTSALVGLLVPAAAVVGLVAVLSTAGPRRLFVVVVVVGLGLAELVNIVTGLSSGPVARSTFAATLGTGLAVVAARGRRPAAFLLGLSVVVLGALSLGAGGRVSLVTVVVAPLGLLSLLMLERSNRRLLVRDRPWVVAILATALVVSAGVAASIIQVQQDDHPSASPFQDVLTRTVDTPDVLAVGGAPTAAPQVRSTAPASVPDQGRRASDHASGAARWWLYALLAALAAAPVVLLLRWALSSLLWRRRYRRSRDGQSVPEVAAWLWTTAHLERMGLALPPSVSPDRVPAEDPLHPLADVVVTAAFAPKGQEQSVQAWDLARSLVRELWQGASRRQRWVARWRFP